MELYWLGFLYYFFICGICETEIPIGFQVTLPLPSMYNMTFIGRAFILETANKVPNFKLALSIEPVSGRYACSLKIFLQGFEVWNSGHFSQFFPRKRCRLDLTKQGDLQLKGSRGKIGWLSATSGQGVERLQLLKTGNLVLTNAKNIIKWQSFNFPTNAVLWSQRLSVPTQLTSFSTNTTMFVSFEIQPNKLALYLNSGHFRYSYWEFRPSMSRNITFVQLGSTGLKLFDDNYRKFAQILPIRHEPLRFLALRSNTGNMEFFHYSAYKKQLQASFQALNTTCDLPLVCGPYGVCTFSNSCACIQVSRHARSRDPNCDTGFAGDFCRNRMPVEMVEVVGVSSIFKIPPQRANVSKEECLNSCIEDCTCVAMLYSISGGPQVRRECFHYGMVRGVKQVKQRIGFSYFVKIPKGVGQNRGSSNLRRWLLTLGGIVDGLVILVAFLGFGYYFVVFPRIRRNNPVEPTQIS